VLRPVWIHEVPRLSVRREDVRYRLKPAGIIQTGGGHRDPSAGLIRFGAGDARSAIAAEASLVKTPGYGICEMMPQQPVCQFKGFCGNQNHRRIGTAGDFLAGAAVAVKHRDRSGRAHVANFSANASSRKGGHLHLQTLDNHPEQVKPCGAAGGFLAAGGS
jgi:hypothetical protein